MSDAPRWPAKTTIWRHPTTSLSLKDRRRGLGRAAVLRTICLLLARTLCARTETHQYNSGQRLDRFFVSNGSWTDKSGIVLVKDRNAVLVVDDDPGMLEGLQRLLWLHAYEPILFVCRGFQNHTDFENVVLHFRHQLKRRVRYQDITSKQQGFPPSHLHNR